MKVPNSTINQIKRIESIIRTIPEGLAYTDQNSEKVKKTQN